MAEFATETVQMNRFTSKTYRLNLKKKRKGFSLVIKAFATKSSDYVPFTAGYSSRRTFTYSTNTQQLPLHELFNAHMQRCLWAF